MLQGWWGHRWSTRFDMNNGELNCFFMNALCISIEMELSEGFGAYRISNPPPVLFGPLFASLEVVFFKSRPLRYKQALYL